MNPSALTTQIAPAREAVKTTTSTAVLPVVLAAIALCCSCADRKPSFQDRVNAVRAWTVPSGAVVISNSELAASKYSATAHWELETNQDRKVYVSWISEQLERDDFKLKSSDELRFVFTKSSRGESESIRVQITPSNGNLRVQIAYAIDSD